MLYKRHLQLEFCPYAYQQEILDNLEAQREVHGHYNNLVVAATGAHAAIIEKDFWVCLTLDYLFHRCRWKDTCSALCLCSGKGMVPKLNLGAPVKDSDMSIFC